MTPSKASKKPSSQVPKNALSQAPKKSPSKREKEQKNAKTQLEQQREIDLLSWGFVGSIGSCCQVPVLFSITKEEVTKAMKRDNCMANKWLDSFLRVAPLLGSANSNGVYLFPFVIPMALHASMTKEEGRKQKLKQMASFFGGWSKNIKPEEWSESFNSVAMIINLDAFTGTNNSGKICFEEHYIVLHIHFQSHTATFYDSISDFEHAGNPSFNLEAWDKSLILCFAYMHMCKSIEASDGKVWVTEEEKLRGERLPLGKNKEKLRTRVLVKNGSTLFNSHVPISVGCGEICCMEILGLLDPDFKNGPAWKDVQRHRAYIIAVIIHFMIKDNVTLNSLGTSEQTHQMRLNLCRQLMQVDFGNTFEDIFENVCKSYCGWPKCLTCKEPDCVDALYRIDGDCIVVRCCCGHRMHAECYLKSLESETKIPGCSEIQCVKNKQHFSDGFLFIDCKRECVDAIKTWDLNKLKTFLKGAIENDAQTQNLTEGYWGPWNYLKSPEAETLFEYTGSAGKKRSLQNNASSADRDASAESTPFGSPSKKQKQKHEMVTVIPLGSLPAKTLPNDGETSLVPFGQSPQGHKPTLEDGATSVRKLASLPLESNNILMEAKPPPKRTPAELVPFNVSHSDVAYLQEDPIPGPFVDCSIGKRTVRVETNFNTEGDTKDLNKLLKSLFFPTNAGHFINCPRCNLTFDSIPAFEHHFALTKLFGACSPSRVSSRGIVGPSIIFIPNFVLKFIQKLASTSSTLQLRIDDCQNAAKLPVLNVHDRMAKKRAECKREDMILVSEGKLGVSEFFQNAVDRLQSVLDSGTETPPCFGLSPFLAYMPYLSIWESVLMGCLDSVVHSCLYKLRLRLIAKVEEGTATTSAFTPSAPDLLSTPMQASFAQLSTQVPILNPKTSVQTLPSNWHYDKESQVLLGKFNGDAVGQDARNLAHILGFSNVAIVTEGLVQPTLPGCGMKLMENFLYGYTFSAICFNSEVVEGQIVTTEDTKRIAVTSEEYVKYLKRRAALIQKAGSLAKAMQLAMFEAGVSFSGSGRQIHAARAALYLVDTDLSCGEQLQKQFKDGLSGVMSKMLPSSNWCLTNLVRFLALDVSVFN